MTTWFFFLMSCLFLLFFLSSQWSRLGVLHCSLPLERFPAVALSSSVSLPTFHKTLEMKVCALGHSSTPEGGDAAGLTDLQDELLRLMGKNKKKNTPVAFVSLYHSLALDQFSP